MYVVIRFGTESFLKVSAWVWSGVDKSPTKMLFQVVGTGVGLIPIRALQREMVGFGICKCLVVLGCELWNWRVSSRSIAFWSGFA